MKKLYKIETNASTLLASYDDDKKIVRILDNEETNGENAVPLSAVEDDSSWDMYEGIEDFEEWLGIDYTDPDTPRIVEEIEF